MAEDPRTDPASSAPVATDPPETQQSQPTQESQDAVAALTRERDDYRDRLLRTAAEFDNYRKRIERERREHADHAIIGLLQEILLVVDDFDRALAVEAGEDASAYRKGVELINGKLHDLLRKYNVKPIEALGTDFDPNLHQAVVHEESPDHRDGEVIEELRRGYKVGDRLLRPAMVKVAKA